MPTLKRHASDASLDNDNDDNDSAPSKSVKISKLSRTSEPSKSTDLSKKASSNSPPSQEVDDEGNPFWALSSSGHRRVGVSEFKGTVYIGIRDVYFKDGKCLPAKKGISLTIEQYTALMQTLSGVEAALKEKGIDVPRPMFDERSSVGEDAGTATKHIEETKRNFEATSDEESS